jgi:hypothetical protein
VAEAATLVTEKGFISCPLHHEMSQGIGRHVALKAEVFPLLYEKGPVRAAVGVVTDRAAADSHRTVNILLTVLPFVTLVSKLRVIAVDTERIRRFFVAEAAVVLGDDAVRPVQAI